MATTCVMCGARKTFSDVLVTDLSASTFVCQPCQEIANVAKWRDEEIRKRAEEDRIAQIKQAAAKVIVTTTPRLDGTVVVAYLGIESVESVIGTGIFSEVSSEVADFFGARSSAFEKKLQAAKQTAMDTLKFRVAEKGANAIIGIDMDYAEFSGNRVALIINGTLVKLAPVQGRPATKN